jgi:hypothetical protein
MRNGELLDAAEETCSVEKTIIIFFLCVASWDWAAYVAGLRLGFVRGLHGT